MTIRWLTFLFFFLGSALAAVPPAKGASSHAQPRIEAFYVNPANQLTPGTELVFRAEGTPYANASVRISGIPGNIPLKEVEPGIYESTYTIRSRDRIAADRTAHVTLRARGRTAVATLSLEAPHSTAAPLAAPAIERFTSVPLERLEPGADLRFTLIGTPGGKAFVTIEGVAKGIPMREVKSGHYEGSYTIRNRDNFAAEANTFASLEAAGQSVRAWLNQPLVAHAKAPLAAGLPLQISSHKNNAVVGTGPIEVRGRTAPGAEVDVQVNAVASLGGLFGVTQQILSRSIRADGDGNFAFSFESPVPVPGTRYEISVKARTAQATKDMDLVLLQQK